MQKFSALLAEAARRYAKRVGSCGFVDETYLRVGKKWAYLLPLPRCGRPKGKAPPHRAARKRALTTKSVKRSHVPIKDWTRPMRGLGAIETGQRLLEGIELAHAARRGDIRPPERDSLNSVHERSRLEVAALAT